MIDLDPYKEYKILSLVDLSLYFSQGKSWLYNTIKSLHKPVFEEDERIIFFLDQSDIFEYVDSEGEIESCLNQFLKEIDIPEYFVIKKFQADKIIQSFKDTKCFLPWLHLYFDPTGKILPCCLANGNFGNVRDVTNIDQALNNDAYKSLRLAMLDNKRSKACAVCYNKEKYNLTSSRQYFNNLYKQKYEGVFDKTNSDGSISKIVIRDAVVGLDNICNFKCRTCYRDLSFKIEQEDIALGELEQPLVKNKDNENFQLFLDDVKQQLTNIEYFHFFGGEPLLTDEHYNILDLLIANNYTNLNISYHTNLSVLKYKQKSIIDYWKQFPNLTVKASLDGSGKKAEYIRHGTSWSKIVNNIKTIKEELPHVNFKINSTFSIYNSLHLVDFHKALIDDKLFACKDIEVNEALGDTNDIRMLPDYFKQQIETNILNFIEHIKPLDNSDALIENYIQMIEFIKSEDRTYLIPKFLERVAVKDRYRKENFFETFPELQSIIDFKN